MSVRVTWWGHATATIELGGVRLLTDPLLAPRLGHLRRVADPVPPGAASGADAVLISHLHLDHLHLPSLRKIDADVLVLPDGGQPLAERVWAPAGERRATPAVPGTAVAIGAVTVRAVAAHHDGRRWPGSHTRGPALGYLIEHDGVRVWFAGDTGLFTDLVDLAPVDAALVPVGGWGPTLGPEHLDPAQAAAACAAVQARHAVPMHYGTYWPAGLRRVQPGSFERLCREPGQRFAAAVADLDITTEVHVLNPADCVDIDVGPPGG